VRICLVTPFDWSQPHDVNEHVAGVAAGLRALGHEVTVLAPSSRPRDLLESRRALDAGATGDVVSIGPAVPVSRRSRLGMPIGARTTLELALGSGRFDVVHGFEPGMPSLSYLALRDGKALAVASFLSARRLGYPPGRAQRERLLGRLDALVAASDRVAAAAAARFPGDYLVVPVGVDLELFRPGEKEQLIVAEWAPPERQFVRALIRTLPELPDWRLLVLRTKPLAGRPYVPRELVARVSVRTLRDGEARAPVFARAAVFVPAAYGRERLRLEAAAAGAAVAAPDGMEVQPELAAAAAARLAEDAAHREHAAAAAGAEAAGASFAAVAAELDVLYGRLARRRRSRRRDAGGLSGRPWILADLHLHTRWSHDCSIEVPDLLDQAEAEGLGAIAVTDHNVFGGALEAVELARARDLVVIPGEEVKTNGQGEVIGLFLREEIPRGMSFADTVAAIKEQGGVVYLPHPFDRLHAIPDAATLHRHLADVDVLEAYNARLLFDAYNDEAARFAAKYNLTVGAGSDAHVLPGVGTGAVRMRRFADRDEFLESLRTAQIMPRPKSLAYLQGLKWIAQAKERVR
jgi:predicted metal-dependent phosphoesterase TrpH/glycosyltransferase involved in cell wall biosynthesis